MQTEKGSKKRRVGEESLRGLVDFEMPLWQDIFSVVFQYLTGHELNRFLRSSKLLYELVKARAVFWGEFEYSDVNENRRRILENFFFAEIELHSNVDISSPKHPLLRQRYLEEMNAMGHVIDFRVFVRRRSDSQAESGRLLFPAFRSAIIGSKFQECHFWEFLRLFSSLRSRKLQFWTSNVNIQVGDFTRIAELGRFEILKYKLPFSDGGCADSQELLSSVDTRGISILVDVPEGVGDEDSHVDKSMELMRSFLLHSRKNHCVERLYMYSSIFFGTNRTVGEVMDVVGGVNNAADFQNLKVLECFGFRTDCLETVVRKMPKLFSRQNLSKIVFQHYHLAQGPLVTIQSEIVQKFILACAKANKMPQFAPTQLQGENGRRGMGSTWEYRIEIYGRGDLEGGVRTFEFRKVRS